jgi:hypothetical protein
VWARAVIAAAIVLVSQANSAIGSDGHEAIGIRSIAVLGTAGPLPTKSFAHVQVHKIVPYNGTPQPNAGTFLQSSSMRILESEIEVDNEGQTYSAPDQ